MSQTSVNASMRCLARTSRACSSSSALPCEDFARLLELVRFPRRDRELRAHFAQRLGDLQPEAARAAGDERDLSGEVEEFPYAHGSGVGLGSCAIVD